MWPKARCTRGCEETARVSHPNPAPNPDQVFTKLKASGELSHPEDSFYFRTTIDTTDMRVLEGGPPGSAAAGRKADITNPDDPPKRRGRPPKRKADE